MPAAMASFTTTTRQLRGTSRVRCGRLFGWQRAYVLFEQMERHIVGKRRSAGWPPRDTGIEAMKALQDFNDRAGTTFDMLRERLEAMPVWNRGNRADGAVMGA